MTTATHRITKTWLTPDAADRLRQEQAHILEVRLPAIEDALLEAQSSGALIDNGDLDAALSERALFEARLAQINQTLSTAVVRESVSATPSVAGVGTLVTIKFPDDSVETFLFADPSNKVSGHALLSPHSPLGQALLGATAGTEVSYRLPAGTASALLVEVSSL